MTAPPTPPPDAVVLRGGTTTLEILPAVGGKIASLHLAGREWLWTNPVLPRRVPDEATRADDDASYVRTADSGGFDECFPTVSPCTLPGRLPRFGGLRLPDHGELWSHRPAVEVARDAGGESATATWTGRRMPYRLARTALVRPDGRVALRYAVTNGGDAPLPFLWSSHPLLPLGDDTRVHLPAGARLRVDATHHLPVDDAPGGHAWPRLRVEGEAVDVSRPAAVRRGYACKLFVDLPAEPLRLGVSEGDARLEVALDGRDVPHCGLWINERGWTPFEGGMPYRNLGLEPCIGAPDSLRDALGAWDAAAWLAPGETRRWTLEWSAARG